MYKIEAKLENDDKVSSFTVYEGEETTTSFCTVEGPVHLPTRTEDLKSLTLDVKWRGQGLKHGKYYSLLVKSILEQLILLDLDSSRGVTLSLYTTGSSKFTLLTSINAALLGLINTGIPLKGMFYGLQHEDTFFVLNEKEILFSHYIPMGEKQPCTIPKELFEYTKEVIKFSIREQHTL